MFLPVCALPSRGSGSAPRRSTLGAAPPFGLGLRLAASVLLCCTPLCAQWDYTAIGPHALTGEDPVLATPYSIALHPDPTTGLAYAALSGAVAPFGEDPALHSGRTVVEFELESGTVVRSFTVGFYPTELVVTPDGAELYATTSTESTLFRIDLATAAVTTLPITDSLGNPVDFLSGIELDASGTRVIVTSNGGSFDGSSENVVVVDRASGLVSGHWTVAGGLSRFAVRADGRVVLPVGFPGDDFTAPPEIRIIDFVNGIATPVATLPVVVDTADFPAPSDVVLSADGSRAYVTVFGGSAEVFVVDVDNATLLPALALGGPDFVQTAVALSPDGATLAVADFFAGRVRFIDRLTGAAVDETLGFDLPNALVPVGLRLLVAEQGLEQIGRVALLGAYVRGDANLDSNVDLADGIAVLAYLFSGDSLTCLDAADVDDGGVVDIADAISIFSYLFQGGTPPSSPFPWPGTDSTATDPFECNP